MADTQHDFAKLMQRVEAGDNDAAGELLELYGAPILRVIRHKLHPKMRAQFDSVDFYQAVWTSFFTKDVDIARFKTPDELVAFLRKIAHNKVVSEVRKRLIGIKDNVNLERSLDDSKLAIGHAVADRADTPSQIAVANEQYELLVAGQSERDRQIVAMRADGQTQQAIAQKMKINVRTVRRVLQKVQGQN